MLSLTSLIPDVFSAATFQRAIFSRLRVKTENLPPKITIRPIELSGMQHHQWTSHFKTQETHQNQTLEQSASHAMQLLEKSFGELQIFTTEQDYTIRISKKGEPSISSRKPQSTQPVLQQHNVKKQYLIPEGQPCAFLSTIGVMSETGDVRKAKYAKFRQINRFLEFVNDIIPSLPGEGTLQIADYGCGKSYLTFALHHLLTQIHHRSIAITGLDLRDDVVAQSEAVRKQLGIPTKELHFQQGAISSFAREKQIDFAVCLHACDTATDDALAQAVKSQASVILAVPCCQHELHSQIRPQEIEALMQHGILHERFSALATDALRASLLEAAGYKTQVVEFIDMEHTAKNLLIRAVKVDSPRSAMKAASRRYQQLKSFLGLKQFYLETIFPEEYLMSCD